jgi:hypothetical protein
MDTFYSASLSLHEIRAMSPLYSTDVTQRAVRLALPAARRLKEKGNFNGSKGVCSNLAAPIVFSSGSISSFRI